MTARAPTAPPHRRSPRPLVLVATLACMLLTGGCGRSSGVSEQETRDRTVSALAVQHPELEWGASCHRAAAGSSVDWACTAMFVTPRRMAAVSAMNLADDLSTTAPVPDVALVVVPGAWSGTTMVAAVPRCPGARRIPAWWDGSLTAAHRADDAGCRLAGWPGARDATGNIAPRQQVQVTLDSTEDHGWSWSDAGWLALLVGLPLLVGGAVGALGGWRLRHPLGIGACGALVVVAGLGAGSAAVDSECAAHPGGDTMCGFAVFLGVIPAGAFLLGFAPALLATALRRRHSRDREPGAARERGAG